MDPNSNPNYQVPDPRIQPDYRQNPLAVMQKGEKVVCEIKRHPFGLFGLYISLGLGIIVLAVGVAVAPHFVTDLSSQMKTLLILLFLIITCFLLVFMYISTIVYRANRWIITSDSITQIDQNSLFDKRSSQLSMANLEDVTVEQRGLLQTMFNFGTLRVETAGERSKFFFAFCPNPNYYARQILACREAYMRQEAIVEQRTETPHYPNINAE